MINWHRVFAMVVRYWYTMRHSFDKLNDMFYWPAMDILIWGMTGLYFVQTGRNYQSITLFAVLSGLVFWIVTWRAQYEITTNLLSEMWDKNLVNIFSSPLKLSEWLIAFMLFGLIKTVVSLSFSALLAFFLYKLNIFLYGFYIIPIIINLVLTGWAGGFLVSAFIIRFGQKIQTLAWSGVYLIAPFSAIYYPIDILPKWAQEVAKFFPTSYVFEGMRELLFTEKISYDKILVSLILNILYLTLAIRFFVYMFNKSRKLGLSRLI